MGSFPAGILRSSSIRRRNMGSRLRGHRRASVRDRRRRGRPGRDDGVVLGERAEDGLLIAWLVGEEGEGICL